MRLLETHGCQGGAHAGYVRAGWDVTGVDINRNHARYYPGELIIADAATYIREHGHEYDAIHASPPCQWYTRGNAKARATGNSKWSRTIPEIRDALESTGRPFIIENVADAAWDMRDPIMLCGCMFKLSTAHTGARGVTSTRPSMSARVAMSRPAKDVVKALLGVEHDMTWNGLYECLPPAYTEWIGLALIDFLANEVAA